MNWLFLSEPLADDRWETPLRSFDRVAVRPESEEYRSAFDRICAREGVDFQVVPAYEVHHFYPQTTSRRGPYVVERAPDAATRFVASGGWPSPRLEQDIVLPPEPGWTPDPACLTAPDYFKDYWSELLAAVASVVAELKLPVAKLAFVDPFWQWEGFDSRGGQAATASLLGLCAALSSHREYRPKSHPLFLLQGSTNA